MVLLILTIRHNSFFSLLLVFALSFSFTIVAQAVDYPAGIVKSKSESTPWGTMTSSIYYATSDEWAVNPERMVIVETKIDSKYTMAQIKAEVECQDNATGQTNPRWQNTRIENNCNLTSTRVFMNPPKASTMAVFTNHEVTYSRSQSFHISYLPGPVDV